MKHALVCFGNEESYGLLFVGGELQKLNQDIKFFDAEGDKKIIEHIREWNPGYVSFSPMTTFFPAAYDINKKLKKYLPSLKSVYGGHHATAYPEISKLEGIDFVIRGPVRGSIEQILGSEKGIITTIPTNPDDLPPPSREQYFKDIPRMAERYRKVMISILGCPFVCSYCSSSSLHRKKLFGAEANKNYFLGRRSIESIIEEGKTIKKYPTEEIEWVDDDIFTGGKMGEEWLENFIKSWNQEINLPMYVSTTSLNTLKVSDNTLKNLKSTVNCVGVGVQAIRQESLKVFNRGWDNEDQMKKAYERLTSFGYRVNLQAIVGLPVEDPVNDAIETLNGLKRMGPGSIVSIYPLQLYPNTLMEKIALERGFELNNSCVGDTNTGIGGVKFGKDTENTLKNVCKFGTLYVKGKIDTYWGEALEKNGLNHLISKIDRTWLEKALKSEIGEEASAALSIARYHDCVVDRLGPIKGEEVYKRILKTTNIRH